MIAYARLYEPDNEDTLVLYEGMPLDVRMYVATGYTDMRKSIDGLVSVVADGFGFNPRAKSLFCFCGRRADRYKVLFFDGDTYSLALRRLEERSLRWPREPGRLWKLSRRAFFRRAVSETKHVCSANKSRRQGEAVRRVTWLAPIGLLDWQDR